MGVWCEMQSYAHSKQSLPSNHCASGKTSR